MPSGRKKRRLTTRRPCQTADSEAYRCFAHRSHELRSLPGECGSFEGRLNAARLLLPLDLDLLGARRDFDVAALAHQVCRREKRDYKEDPPMQPGPPPSSSRGDIQTGAPKANQHPVQHRVIVGAASPRSIGSVAIRGEPPAARPAARLADRRVPCSDPQGDSARTYRLKGNKRTRPAGPGEVPISRSFLPEWRYVALQSNGRSSGFRGNGSSPHFEGHQHTCLINNGKKRAEVLLPLLRKGGCAVQENGRYLNTAQPGRSDTYCRQVFDLPGRADCVR